MKGKSIGSRVFDCINILFLLIFALICLLPFIYVLAASFSDSTQLINHDFILFPVGFTLETYKYVLFSSSTVSHALLVSVLVTVAGTLLDLSLTSLLAYPLSHTDVLGYKVIMPLVIFTLVFSGGMIPTYIIVMKLGLLNNYLSVLLPNAVSAFNLIIFISFFKSLPRELEEAAKIDGCNDLRILFQIILPLSKPLLATFALMFGVSHWNAWFDYVLYIDDTSKYSIQVVLRQLIDSSYASAAGSASLMAEDYTPPTEVVRYCVVIISTVPVLCVYPFLQKYFSKGIMIGSVKG